MSNQFFSKLSQNYIELLEDDEYYDITIEVGEDPNVKIFRAHMSILCCRSPYLRRTLTSNKKYKDNTLVHIKLPNISPEIFQIILKYIYGGIFPLNGRDDSEIIKEIEVWEHVLKWGLAQNPTLLPDPNTWSDDDFKTMANTLQHCLSLIRFFSLSSKEFLQNVRPYKNLLKRKLYETLLNFHLDPDFNSTDNILLPRNPKIDGIIDSKIVNNLDIISTISRSIVDVNSKISHVRKFHLPYNFQLLLRGSRDGFTPEKFHELCDNISHTVTFIKVKGTDEILGGYSPLIWRSSFSGWGRTKDSFIFSFKNNDIKDAIISNIKDTDCAIYYDSNSGPRFGDDIIMHASCGYGTDYNDIRCKKARYEKKIKDTVHNFSIDDYEVFQIVKR
ncbi:uncharacterized protein OCT59_028505 [Rhizophagus irregularis]|uniref:uncharacterized protein n=1 Tax=Rhizophagus irregularis TaxID=588596 RepID=UPI0033186D5F|nr:hypothetical protein OCT59_028505 [Rhizophagus irregularis]